EQYQKKPLATRQDIFAHNKLYAGGNNPTTGRARVYGRTDWAAKKKVKHRSPLRAVTSKVPRAPGDVVTNRAGSFRKRTLSVSKGRHA
ncbi:hypothetical protein J6590_106529, partial [Homalodisca vitripennis]